MSNAKEDTKMSILQQAEQKLNAEMEEYAVDRISRELRFYREIIERSAKENIAAKEALKQVEKDSASLSYDEILDKYQRRR